MGKAASVFVYAVVVMSITPSFAQSSDDAGVKVCEASIIGGLLSPASYQTFKVTTLPGGVEIIYDASNASGALLRDKVQCVFVARADGLHLSIEPAIVAEQDRTACLTEVQGWVEAGNITERAAAPFIAQCGQSDRARQSAFIQQFVDLGVVYPVVPADTQIAPLD